MKRVRIKICGVRCGLDAAAAAEAGADAIGLVFYRDSPRSVTIEQAQDIDRHLPPFVARVALFLEPSLAAVQTVIEQVRPDVLQFHGRETPAFCRGFGLPYIKAVPMGETYTDVTAWAEAYEDARALLFDANRAGHAGGSGQPFDWNEEVAMPGTPVVLAGGLDADNVATAIRRFSPYAVDVSSGVENESGVKDSARMHAFVDAVMRTG